MMKKFLLMFLAAFIFAHCTKHEEVSKENNDFTDIYNQIKKDFAISFRELQIRYKALSISGMEIAEIKHFLRNDFKVLSGDYPKILSTKVATYDLSETFQHYLVRIEDDNLDIDKMFNSVSSDYNLTYEEQLILISALAVLDEIDEVERTIDTKSNWDDFKEAVEKCDKAFYRTVAKTVVITAAALIAAPETLGATLAIAVAYVAELTDAYIEHKECLSQASRNYPSKDK